MDNNYAFHHVTVAPGQQLGSHTQPTWELSHVTVGSGHRLIGGTSSPFSRGDTVLVPPGMEHAWYFDPEDVNSQGLIENMTLMFSTEMLRSTAALFPVLSPALRALEALDEAVAFSGTAAAHIATRMEGIHHSGERDRIGLVINLVSHIGANLTEGDTLGSNKPGIDTSQWKLRQVEVFVSCNYGRTIGIGDIASHLGMNKSSFCAFFRRESGMTFVNYLNNYRLDHAAYLLKTTDEPVNAIAYACGFQTVPHFNHLFKARFGKAPRSMKV